MIRYRSLLAITLLLPALAHAKSDSVGEWPASFPAARVGSYLDQPPPRVVVIGAGAQDATAAAVALREALVASKRAALVMDQSALGPVASLDDDAIIRKASRLPVERVIIVRVFGGAGAPPNAVVTFFDREGKTVTAFTAEQGHPLATRTEGPGVSSGAAGAVNAVLRTESEEEPPAAKSEAEQAWERQAIWFEDWTGINQYGMVVASWSLPFRGVQREPLRGARFYDAIERSDLAAHFKKKQTTRLALAISGGGLFVAGLGTMIWGVTTLDLFGGGLSGPTTQTQGSVTYAYADSAGPGATPWILTGAFMGVGIALTITAAAINPHPVAAEEARQLAIDYNKRLRKRLGLPDLRRSSRAPHRISDLAVAPSFGPGGGGLTVAFRY